MAGINTDADAGLIFNAVDNGGKVLKLKSKVAALSGGIFDNCRNALGLSKGDVDGFGNARQTLIFRDLHQMAARVKVQQG